MVNFSNKLLLLVEKPKLLMLVKILYKAKWQYLTLDQNALILECSTIAREYSCPYSIKMILIPTIYQWIMHDKVWYS